ncbi:MAG: polysulfide reductase NrfD [Candidatus Atribacteria bacterium]|nr:polysulfide reductase NrfD [Candidatus Atribacteria bacterium]
MTERMKTQNKFLPWIIIFTVLAVVGIVFWILQLNQGLQLTHMDNTNVWGLYIVGFMLCTGLAAGTLLFASSAFLFPGMEEFKPYTRLAVFIGAICSVVAAGFFIIVDIGNPQRAWNIITNLKIASPLLWDTIILLAYAVIGILFTRLLIRVEEGKNNEGSLKVISIIAFIAGLLVTVTSFVFAMWVARPLWNTPVQPLSFLAAAVVVAFAMLVVLMAALNKSGYLAISHDTLFKLGKMAGLFLLVELAVVLSEIALGLYAGTGEVGKIITWLVTGQGAAFFWVEFVFILAGIVLLLLGNKPWMVVLGAAFALVAVFLIKYNLLQAQLLNPLIPYAGPPGYSGVAQGAYLPTLAEILVTVGILSLGGLLVTLGLNGLHLGQQIKGEVKA